MGRKAKGGSIIQGGEVAMDSCHRKLKIFACNSNPELSKAIAANLETDIVKAEVGRFSDGEISVQIFESIRGADVFVIQSLCAPVHDNIMELLIVIDALKRASARSITAVVPYYGYARQDRKSQPREPITSKLLANLITAAGASRVLTIDLHAPPKSRDSSIYLSTISRQPPYPRAASGIEGLEGLRDRISRCGRGNSRQGNC